MTKSISKSDYIVQSRYRNGGLWHETGHELSLLPAQAAGPLSQGKIKPKDQPVSQPKASK
jgi:hypothetical protein